MGSYQKAPQKGITKLQYLLRGYLAVIQLPSTMRSKLWATLEKKNHTYYEQDPEKVALFLKNFNSLKHLAQI
ncbi:transposase [Streptococcus pneumoniae]|nr:transposase [Streptococcus pneumoniae]